MARRVILLAALSGFLTVALGAFAAHGLRQGIEPHLLQTFRTGVNYQGLHSLALLMIGILGLTHPSPWLWRSAWLMLAGILLFSGSLYLLALTGVRGIGMVTPFGGGAYLAGWLALAASARELGKQTR